MLSTVDFGERFFHTDPFPHLEMDAEIAELRTMTRVTKLRQQIECRQEGAWMTVRDVPDDRARNGTRKVTSFGRTTRSVTRSYTSDVDFDSIIDPRPGHHQEAIVEFPEEQEVPQKPHSVEITEVTDDPKSSPEPESSSPAKTSPTKKTSVVTLGQGNVVLIDPQDSHFKVTGLKDSTDEDVSSKPTLHNYDKKVKKVGFSKTEVHFAPDSGRVNIVETDEKPPSSQVLRRKKKPRREGPPKTTTLPKLYFGDSEKREIFKEPEKLEKEPSSLYSHHFAVIREPSPLLSTIIANQAQSRRQSDVGGYADPKKSPQPARKQVDQSKSEISFGRRHSLTKSRESSFERVQNSLTSRDVGFNIKTPFISQDISPVEARKTSLKTRDNSAEKTLKISKSSDDGSEKGSLPSKSRESSFDKGQSWFNEPKHPYLGNLSPRLSKLISNDIQHEFQLKQMEILKKSWEPELKTESREPSLDKSNTSSARSEDDSIPVAVNIHVTADDMKMAGTKPTKIVTHVQVSLEKDGKVEPQPRTKRLVSEPVYINNTASRGVTRTIKVTREEESSKGKTLTRVTDDKDRRRARTPSKAQVRKTPTPRLREPKREVAVVKPMKPCVRSTLTRPERSEPSRRSLAKTESSDSSTRTPREPRSREPAESVRSKKTKEPLRSFEKVSNGWVGRCIVPVKTAKASSRVSVTTTSTSSSATPAASSKTQGVKRDKEVPASKSVSSVKIEKDFQSRNSLSSQKQFSLSREHLRSAKLVKELSRPDVPRPKSLAVHPRVADGPKKNLVSRRRLAFEEHQAGSGQPGRNSVRRDSEQSDDSVVRADEEVRAYMFNSKNKTSE